MGKILLKEGTAVNVDDLPGQVDLEQVVRDIRSGTSPGVADYTESYLIATIGVLGRLGKHAEPAVSSLEAIAKGKNSLLRQAAEEALGRISTGVPSTRPAPQAATASAAEDYSAWKQPAKKQELNRVRFEEVASPALEDGLRAYIDCKFCQKLCMMTTQAKNVSRILAGDKHFYCLFCLRNGYYNSGQDTMLLSLRGLIGYYYYAYYVAPKSPSMNLLDLRDIIALHESVGGQNPLFRYDAETYSWFVDFSKVGEGDGKLPLNMILMTVIEMIAAFNIYENVRIASPQKYYLKFARAIDAFAKDRTRQQNRQVCTPTLYNCGIPSAGLLKPIPVDLLYDFMPSHVTENFGANKNRRYSSSSSV
jgi:hypothetical protein